MGLDNDARGWIMAALSGFACIIGAMIICVDIVVRLFPGMKHFEIGQSNAFLSSSLSLSFGVMLFSSLFNMLPSAKAALQRDGYSARASSWLLIILFLVGALGIQVLSRILHRYIPSHVVACDHYHDEEEANTAQEPMAVGETNDGQKRDAQPALRAARAQSEANLNELGVEGRQESNHHGHSHTAPRRQMLARRASSRFTIPQLITNTAADECDERGHCLGFSDVCTTECFDRVQSRGGSKLPHLPLTRSKTNPTLSDSHHRAEAPSRKASRHNEETPLLASSHSTDHSSQSSSAADTETSCDHHPKDSTESDHAHHHHVPTNAFLSIGLQTSLAIALHKLPEGFITYATNHANPKLGVTVFLALFLHNITEGFAMALPLYLALGGRLRAIGWSVVLGGLSQPAGAGIAALWLKFAGQGARGEMGEAVYGAMFAVTGGIMSSVALQLFSESLDLTHSKNLCMLFAFIGMGIMGASSALLA